MIRHRRIFAANKPSEMDLAESWFIRLVVIKERARRFLEKIRPCPTLWEPFKATAHLIQLLAIGILIPNDAHSSVRGLFLLHTYVCNGAKNKFGSCCQWCNELFRIIFFHLSAPLAIALGVSHRRCQERNKCLYTVQPTAARGGAESLQGSHRMGNWRIFLTTSLPLSLINTYRMNQISAQFSLAGQYL